MSDILKRRDFLKLAGLVTAGMLLPYRRVLPAVNRQTEAGPNILVIIFDTWSAQRCSLYGHSRLNTPNLERLAEKAVVYHNHISGGNYTLPGTASMLTGMLPWQHRAFDFPLGPIERHYVDRNIFRLFEDYERIVYTHNPLAEILLKTLLKEIDDYTERYELMLDGEVLISRAFANDFDAASVAWLQSMKGSEEGLTYSLFASRFHSSLVDKKLAPHIANFPLGLPRTHFEDHFILEDGIDFVVDRVRAADDPFLGYFHFLPPHHPYHTRKDFFQRFHRDDYVLPDKPEHLFTQGISYSRLDEQSTWYDEFILYVDAEFGRLYDALEEAGTLENTWIFLTSDHGELFERGIRGHNTPTLYQPVIHVPLMVFPPGQNGREDVFTTTSGADLLPTMLEISGKSQQIESWMEGQVLPPFEQAGSGIRTVFSMEAQEVLPNAPMGPGTVAGFREDLKMIYYFGYPELGESGERIELYDLQSDPGELNDLFPVRPELGAELLEAIRAAIRSRDAAFTQT